MSIFFNHIKHSATVLSLLFYGSSIQAAEHFLPKIESVTSQLNDKFLILPDPDGHFGSSLGTIGLRLNYYQKQEDRNGKTWADALQEAKKGKSPLHFSLFANHEILGEVRKLFIPTDETFTTPDFAQRKIIPLGNYTLKLDEASHSLTRQPAPVAPLAPIDPYNATSSMYYTAQEPLTPYYPLQQQPYYQPYPIYPMPYYPQHASMGETRIAELEHTVASLQLEVATLSHFTKTNGAKSPIAPLPAHAPIVSAPSPATSFPVTATRESPPIALIESVNDTPVVLTLESQNLLPVVPAPVISLSAHAPITHIELPTAPAPMADLPVTAVLEPLSPALAESIKDTPVALALESQNLLPVVPAPVISLSAHAPITHIEPPAAASQKHYAKACRSEQKASPTLPAHDQSLSSIAQPQQALKKKGLLQLSLAGTDEAPFIQPKQKPRKNIPIALQSQKTQRSAERSLVGLPRAIQAPAKPTALRPSLSINPALIATPAAHISLPIKPATVITSALPAHAVHASLQVESATATAPSLSATSEQPKKATKKSKDLSRFEVPSEPLIFAVATTALTHPEMTAEQKAEQAQKALERAARKKEKIAEEQAAIALMKERKITEQEAVQAIVIDLIRSSKFKEALEIRAQLNLGYPSSALTSAISLAQTALFRPHLVSEKEIHATYKKVTALLAAHASPEKEQSLTEQEQAIAHHFLIHFAETPAERDVLITKSTLDEPTSLLITCDECVRQLTQKCDNQCSFRKDCVHLKAHAFLQDPAHDGIKQYPEYWKACLYTYASPCTLAVDGIHSTRESRAQEIIEKARAAIGDNSFDKLLTDLTETICCRPADTPQLTTLNSVARNHGTFNLALFKDKCFIPVNDLVIEANMKTLDAVYPSFSNYDQTSTKKHIVYFLYSLQKMMTPAQIKAALQKYPDKEWTILLLQQARGRFSEKELIELSEQCDSRMFLIHQTIPNFWHTFFSINDTLETPTEQKDLIEQGIAHLLDALAKGSETLFIDHLNHYTDHPLCKQVLTCLDALNAHSDYSETKKLFINLHISKVALKLESNQNRMVQAYAEPLFARLSEVETLFTQVLEASSTGLNFTIEEAHAFSVVFKTLTDILLATSIKKTAVDEPLSAYARSALVYPFLKKLLSSTEPLLALIPMKILALCPEDNAFILSALLEKIQSLPDTETKKHYQPLLQAIINLKRQQAGPDLEHFFSKLPHEKVDFEAFKNANHVFGISTIKKS